MNIFLRNLPRKSFKNPDELERVLKSYVAGARVTGDDSEGFTLQALEEDGKHTYKIHLISDGGSSERVTVERVEQLNSKDNMNYYAKLIEKRNSTVSRGTVHGHKYEVDKIDYLGQATYMGYVYDKEGNTIFKTSIYTTAAGAEQEIKGKVFNSKEGKGYYQSIIEKKNALPEFKYCYQAMQWFKAGSQYAEVIDKLVDRFHLDKSTAAAAAQKGQQMYEDSYRNK